MFTYTSNKEMLIVAYCRPKLQKLICFAWVNGRNLHCRVDSHSVPSFKKNGEVRSMVSSDGHS
jgi:hypothetical protein